MDGIGNKTGYLSRAEFASVMHNLSEQITLENVRIVMNFFDSNQTGKISIFEFLKVI